VALTPPSTATDRTMTGPAAGVDRAYAVDAAGNLSLMSTTSVTIDNTAPVFTSPATAAAIDENSGAGQVVYTATATDAGTVQYSLSGADAARFSINASSGAVTLTANPDFETQSSYSFNVVATDAAGNASTRDVTLAVNNLDEVEPTITSGAVATAIDENSGAGQLVYTATSTDS